MTDIHGILTLPVFMTSSGASITAMHYAAAVAIANEKQLGRVNKRPIMQRPAWRVIDYMAYRRKAGNGAKTPFNTYASPPKADPDAYVEDDDITIYNVE